MAISKLKPRKISDGKVSDSIWQTESIMAKIRIKQTGDDWFPPTSVLPKLPRRNL